MECEVCGAQGQLLGNVRATPRERTFAAARAELQHCAACGSVTRFPRYNDVRKVLQTRQGRCGEYASVLFQLAQALGWRTRLVVDWLDHVWVEVLVPMPADGEAEIKGSEELEQLATTLPGPTQAIPGGRLAAPIRLITQRRPSGKRAVRRRRFGAGHHRWVALDPCEATVDEPHIYGEWGKTHTYVIAFGDGALADVTPTYAKDWNATLNARDLSPEQLTRALGWVRRLPRRPWL